MGIFDVINGRGRGGRPTPSQLVAAKSVVNFIVTDAFAGTTVGQLNVATEYYYGQPKPEDYEEAFDLLLDTVITMDKRRKNGK